MVQAVAKGVLGSIDEGRELIGKSFELQYYEPRDQDMWQEAYGRFCELFDMNSLDKAAMLS